MAEPEQRPCPRCGGPIRGYPALSRTDNRSEICDRCGTEEAMRDFAAADLEPPDTWPLEQPEARS